MKNLPNVEKSGFRRGEYVGYSAGKVWRIRKTLFGGWKWAAHVAGDFDSPTIYGDTLEQISARLERMASKAA